MWDLDLRSRYETKLGFEYGVWRWAKPVLCALHMLSKLETLTARITDPGKISLSQKVLLYSHTEDREWTCSLPETQGDPILSRLFI